MCLLPILRRTSTTRSKHSSKTGKEVGVLYDLMPSMTGDCKGELKFKDVARGDEDLR